MEVWHREFGFHIVKRNSKAFYLLFVDWNLFGQVSRQVAAFVVIRCQLAVLFLNDLCVLDIILMKSREFILFYISRLVKHIK